LKVGVGEHPELKTKAWNSRLVSGFLAHEICVEKNLSANGGRWPTIAALAWALAEFYQVMEAEGRFMSAEGSARFVRAGEAMLQLYHGLAKDASAKGQLMYGLRPKMHLLSHLCIQVAHDKLNPRFFHCFKDEDMIGRTVKVASKCHRVTISQRMLQRYMLRLLLRWHGHAPKRHPRKHLVKRPAPKAIKQAWRP
jgi:hypothetical protein